MAHRNQDFQTIRSEGGLLPPDILRRVLDPSSKLDGTRPESYGLPKGERLNEVITQCWNRLRKHWSEFRAAASRVPEGEAGTGLTNDKWSLPLLRELGFGLLPTSVGPEIGGRSYAISRFFGPVPVHLVGCGLSLDRRAVGKRGAAAANPHGLVQEFLNRSEVHLWGIVSNGLSLRVLRDNQALSRQSFLEFDLEAMYAGEVYSDFVLLWLMVHATRFAPQDGDRPDSCWLERWAKEAEEQGTRALGDLRGSVERALQILGEGFTSHPKNAVLRDALRTGQVTPADLHGQLLRTVYRLIFLFVAEDRKLDSQPLLHPRDATDAARTARERYAAYYGTARLRELAGNIKGSRHGDLWRQIQLLVGALSGDAAFAPTRAHLALPALGSFLWSPASTAALNDVELTNHDFLEALRNLAFTRQGKVLRPVDYRNLGAEELGGVYEGLLALTPQISADGARFNFAEFAGNERKTSGSYYTHDSLVQCLLDSALDPVVEEAIRGKTSAEAERAILALKVCDPAVGSGHFLVGAAHRLARHLSRVRAIAQGDSEPSPLLYQHALRDVIGRCIYGVDINPMAAELCRVSLWLEALEPGKPLSFLDHHIRVGNSLLGGTPDLINAGLPDNAFTCVEGEDKRLSSALKKRNKQEREGGQLDMLHLMVADPQTDRTLLADRVLGINQAPDETIDDIKRKTILFDRLILSPEYRHAQALADAWCAAFVWVKRADAPADAPTTDTLRRLKTDSSALTKKQVQEVERLTGQYRFFHWHLAFPEVFAKGYFDCVIGNPPWDRISLKEREFFDSKDAEIAKDTNSATRSHRIIALANYNTALFQEFTNAHDIALRTKHMLSACQRYPLSAVGDINTYALFTDLYNQLAGNVGRCGIITQTQLVTEKTYSGLTRHLLNSHRIESCFSFENEHMLFSGAHHSTRFILLTLATNSLSIKCAAALWEVAWLSEPARRYSIGVDDVRRLNPDTWSIPQFRGALDANIATRIYASIPLLGNADTMRKDTTISRVMHDKDDAAVLSWDAAESISLDRLPLLESKLFEHYNHRSSTYEGVAPELIRNGYPRDVTSDESKDPYFEVLPRKWVALADTPERFQSFPRSWLLHVRKIANNIMFRTITAAITPKVPNNGSAAWVRNDLFTVRDYLCLLGVMNSFVFDYLARQKVAGLNVNSYHLMQLPVPKLPSEEVAIWHDPVVWRVFELTYCANDLSGLARELGDQIDSPVVTTLPPFRWVPERRERIRAELDAILAFAYGLSKSELDWIIDAQAPSESFRVLRETEIAAYGEFRTKLRIMESYDEFAQSLEVGNSFQSRLDPPPADPLCCHLPRAD